LMVHPLTQRATIRLMDHEFTQLLPHFRIGDQ
jgi:hypothetical protein